MDSLAKRIRGHIQKHGPSSPSQIAIGLDLDSSLKVSWSLNVMLRNGIVTRTGSGHRFTYSLAREVYEQPAAAPKRTWAEYQAELQAKKAARLAREAQDRAARIKATEAKPKPVKVQPSARRPFDTPLEPRRASVIEMPVAKPVLMSSQEWEKAGGKVERLESNWQTPIHPRRPNVPMLSGYRG